MNLVVIFFGLVLLALIFWFGRRHRRTGRQEEFRRDFVANISHEFRTPLTVIAGYLETLLDGKTDNTTRGHLEIIREHTERLIAMVDKILELSRLENVAPERSLSLIHLPVFFAGLKERFRQRLEAKSLRWTAVLIPPLENFQSDPGLLDMILSNLIDNAIKYSDRDAIVTLTGSRVGGKIRFSVEDTGIGIPVEAQGRIFERFYRVDNDRSRETGGSGLGLSIVKHAVSALEGEIRVESKPGKGSLFSFTISEG